MLPVSMSTWAVPKITHLRYATSLCHVVDDIIYNNLYSNLQGGMGAALLTQPQKVKEVSH